MHTASTMASQKLAVSARCGLLVRPPMFVGECELGYMERIALQNGLWRADLMINHAHLVSLKNLQGAPLAWTLATNQSTSEYRQFEGGLRDVPSWAQHRYGTASPPVCLQCLAESMHIRAAWHLKGLDICPIHDAPMVAPWTNGGRRASMREVVRAGNLSLQGKPMAGDNQASPASIEIRLNQQLWGPVLAAGATELEFASAIFCIHLFRTILRYGRASKSLKQCHIGSNRILQRISRWLEQQKLGTRGDLVTPEQMLQHLGQGPLRNRIFQCVAELLALEARRPTVLSALPLARWQSHLEGRGAAGADGVKPVALSDLAKQQGVSRAHLHRAVAARGTVPKLRFGAHRYQSHISAHDALHIAAVCAAGLSRSAAATNLGLVRQRESMRRLRDAKLLQFQFGGSGPYLRMSVEQLLNDLDKASKPEAHQRTTKISLADSRLIGRWNPVVIAELFTLLKTDQICLWKVDQGIGLDQYRVPLDCLQRMSRRSEDLRRANHNPYQLELFDACAS